MEYISSIPTRTSSLLNTLLIARSNNNIDYIKEILRLDNIDEDEESSSIRIGIDQYFKISILDHLRAITEGIIPEHILIGTIINFCMNDIFNSNPNINNTINGKIVYPEIRVPKETWRKFKKMCRSRELKLNNVFRCSVLEFLDDRGKMLI